MSLLRDFFAPRQKLLTQAQKIKRLEQQVSELRMQNDSMRAGMRRCLTCDYRLEAKQRQDASLQDASSADE